MNKYFLNFKKLKINRENIYQKNYFLTITNRSKKKTLVMKMLAGIEQEALLLFQHRMGDMEDYTFYKMH
jgi:hypothetical protein